MEALIIVDLQNDFCTGGALEVKGGENLVTKANELMELFPLVIATQDWHPADHGSFAANHLWRKPGQVIDLNGLQQILWPIHCVQNSFGARFVNGLNLNGIDQIVQKGTVKEVDSYSGFFDNGKQNATTMEHILRENKVSKVYVMGLATDYCVKFTAMDAKSLGFETVLIEDASMAVNLQPDDEKNAVLEMKNAGIIVSSFAKIVDICTAKNN